MNIQEAAIGVELATERLHLALRSAEVAHATYRLRPDARHYVVAAVKADHEVALAAGVLGMILDEAEDATDDQWVREWLEYGRRRLAMVEQAVHAGGLRVKGYFG